MFNDGQYVLSLCQNVLTVTYKCTYTAALDPLVKLKEDITFHFLYFIRRKIKNSSEHTFLNLFCKCLFLDHTSRKFHYWIQINLIKYTDYKPLDVIMDIISSTGTTSPMVDDTNMLPVYNSLCLFAPSHSSRGTPFESIRFLAPFPPLFQILSHVNSCCVLEWDRWKARSTLLSGESLSSSEESWIRLWFEWRRKTLGQHGLRSEERENRGPKQKVLKGVNMQRELQFASDWLP